MKIKQVKFWAIILLIFTLIGKIWKMGYKHAINKINKKNAKIKDRSEETNEIVNSATDDELSKLL